MCVAQCYGTLDGWNVGDPGGFYVQAAKNVFCFLNGSLDCSWPLPLCFGRESPQRASWLCARVHQGAPPSHIEGNNPFLIFYLVLACDQAKP